MECFDLWWNGQGVTFFRGQEMSWTIKTGAIKFVSEAA